MDQSGATNYNVALFSFAALAWTLWRIRNNMVFEKNFIKNLIDVIFKTLSCLQQWRVLLQKDEGGKLDCLLTASEAWVKNFCNKNDSSSV